VWLVCQLAAVSAFVPRDCCARHRKAASVSKSHQGGDGAARHSHHGGHGAMHDSAPATDHDPTCVMRDTCNGPLDAIATLFMQPGLPLQPLTLLDDGAPRPGFLQVDANALDTLQLPTTPPPRV
jgi:hypothetical protein